jgi:hypothetical protein
MMHVVASSLTTSFPVGSLRTTVTELTGIFFSETEKRSGK